MSEEAFVHRKPPRAAIWLAWAILATALALLVTVGWLLFWPTGAFTKVDIVFVDEETGVELTKTPEIRAGQMVSYQVSYCIAGRVPRPVTVRRAIQLQNHDISYALSEIGYQPCETVVRSLEVPKSAHPGRYRIRMYTDVEVSPLFRSYQSYRSPEFLIVK